MSPGGMDLDPVLETVDNHSYNLIVSRQFESGIETVTAKFFSLSTANKLAPESVIRTFA